MKQHLTAGRIRDLQLPIGKDQAFLRDTDVTGFAVRVTSGSKSFIFQAKMAGKDIRITIGSVAAWAIEDARAEARRFQTLMDKGIDPRQEKIERLEKIEEARVERQRIETTFGEAWQAYIAAKKSKWSDRHYFDHERAVSEKRTPGPLAEFINLKLTEITPDRIKTWLDKNNLSRPTYTAICFRKLRAFLNWASDQNEYIGAASVDACSKKVAVDRVAKNKVKDDCIQREQVKPWFDAVKSLSNPKIAAYLQILLLTGARREELASLKSENTDLKWKSMSIKDKVDGSRTIPLTPYVESLLRDIKTRNETPPPETRILHGKKIPTGPWKPSEWVFSSQTSESGRIVEPRIALNRAVKEAGLPPLTLHGLRRSFGTLAEWTEAPVGVVAQIMGHKPSALAEKHYRRRPIDLLRMWHTKIEMWILEQAAIDLPKDEALKPSATD